MRAVSDPTVSDYLGLTTRSQVAQIRAVAVAALADYDLDVARLRLLRHEFNTTFRLDTTDGHRYALRVNVNSRKSPQHLDAEVAWLAALASDTDVTVPTPVATRAGALRTSVWCDVLRRELPVVIMSWLPGRDLADDHHASVSAASVRALGRTMAVLHRHAATWSPPPGTSFPSLGPVLVDQPDRLAAAHPALTPSGREVLAAAHAVAQAAHDRVIAGGPVHALHADLHGGNVKWYRQRMAVFDFDDAVIGAPIQDLAISAYYLRDESALEAALFAGYAEVRSLPEVDPASYEAIVAGRNLILVNDVLAGLGSADRDIGPAYIRNTVVKLRSFLECGVYRHHVPGLEPLQP